MLLVLSIIPSALALGIATKAQSCFNSITPISDLSKWHCLKSKPAISPFDILSFRPPEINSVLHGFVILAVFPFGITVSVVSINSGVVSFSHCNT